MAGAALLAATSACAAGPEPVAGAAARPLRAPALNHVYVVVDAETFAALRDSAVLSSVLGRTDGGLPDYPPPTADADRIFFRGRRTYLEIFAPGNRFDEPVGKVGLGLGLDLRADFDALDAAWGRHCGEGARRTPVAWRRTAPPTPWYDAIQCDDTASGPDLAVWAMVYRPEFQRWQASAPDDAPHRTARADILSPRASAGQGRFDITGLALNLSPSLRDRLVLQFVAAGFAHRVETDQHVLSGDGLVLRLNAGSDATGLVAINLAVAPTAPVRFSLGSLEFAANGTGAATLSVPAKDRP